MFVAINGIYGDVCKLRVLSDSVENFIYGRFGTDFIEGTRGFRRRLAGGEASCRFCCRHISAP